MWILSQSGVVTFLVIHSSINADLVNVKIQQNANLLL